MQFSLFLPHKYQVSLKDNGNVLEIFPKFFVPIGLYIDNDFPTQVELYGKIMVRSVSS